MPLLVEPVVRGATATDEERRSPQVLRHICRIGVELGADVLKVAYPGDPEAFRGIVAELPVPVVVLGGPRMESPRDVLAAAASAVAAGAAGLAFGRNVFQAPDPPALLRALRRSQRAAIRSKTVHEEGMPARKRAPRVTECFGAEGFAFRHLSLLAKQPPQVHQRFDGIRQEADRSCKNVGN